MHQKQTKGQKKEKQYYFYHFATHCDENITHFSSWNDTRDFSSIFSCAFSFPLIIIIIISVLIMVYIHESMILMHVDITCTLYTRHTYSVYASNSEWCMCSGCALCICVETLMWMRTCVCVCVYIYAYKCEWVRVCVSLSPELTVLMQYQVGYLSGCFDMNGGEERPFSLNNMYRFLPYFSSSCFSIRILLEIFCAILPRLYEMVVLGPTVSFPYLSTCTTHWMYSILKMWYVYICTSAQLFHLISYFFFLFFICVRMWNESHLI